MVCCLLTLYVVAFGDPINGDPSNSANSNKRENQRRCELLGLNSVNRLLPRIPISKVLVELWIGEPDLRSTDQSGSARMQITSETVLYVRHRLVITYDSRG